MKCVKCSGSLESVRVGSVPVDRCDHCQGIWFDRRELRNVLDAYRDGESIPMSVPSPESKRHEHKGGSCPRCNVPLARAETLAVEGLHWDTCDKCGGAWLDGGELTIIAADPDAAAAAAFFSES
jgi:Zn-finger nucleic acid-binding protein